MTHPQHHDHAGHGFSPLSESDGRSPADRRTIGPGLRAALYIAGGVLALAVPCCGGAAVLGAVTDDPKPSASPHGGRQGTTRVSPSAAEATPVADATSGSTPTSPAPTSASAGPSPVVERRQVTETQEIPFRTTKVNDASLAKGSQQVRVKGVPGVKTVTYEVTLTDGVQTDRKVVGETVTKPAVDQVIAVGTKAATGCDPHYSGGCVPIASDVDCAGGKGNGPAYVKGPVTVIGEDIYELDADGDGIGCEAD